MKNGEAVAAFEREFAAYVGAKYAIALCNGTATLHTALVALGVKPGDRVAVPPLTMSATTIAVLHAGAVPIFVDVDPDTWLMDEVSRALTLDTVRVPVSLYGLHQRSQGVGTVDDAAQTFRPHGGAAFTSYSFQASKILALGEGGMLVTDDEELATRAREFSSLGYRMKADQPRIDPAALKSPTFERHHSLGWNYRMSDLVAKRGLRLITPLTRENAFEEGLSEGAVWADIALDNRRYAASLYCEAISGCDWLTPQHVPDGWGHDYWTYAVKVEENGPTVRVYNQPQPVDPELLGNYIIRHGGERPYAAWRLTYQEPAFRHLASDGTCLVAEDLQPRLMQFQTNDLASAERNADALAKAIKEIGG